MIVAHHSLPCRPALARSSASSTAKSGIGSITSATRRALPGACPAHPRLPDYAGLRSDHQQQPPGTDLDAQSWSLSTSFGDREVGEP